jgi:hypothetical protein
MHLAVKKELMLIFDKDRNSKEVDKTSEETADKTSEEAANKASKEAKARRRGGKKKGGVGDTGWEEGAVTPSP